MGKIKGWKRFVGRNDVWRGSNIYRVVQVTKSNNSLGSWAMSVHGMDKEGEVNFMGLKYQRFFDTKQEALEYAINYMRRNPNG